MPHGEMLAMSQQTFVDFVFCTRYRVLVDQILLTGTLEPRLEGNH